jgi:hypothetical protein
MTRLDPRRARDLERALTPLTNLTTFITTNGTTIATNLTAWIPGPASASYDAGRAPIGDDGTNNGTVPRQALRTDPIAHAAHELARSPSSRTRPTHRPLTPRHRPRARPGPRRPSPSRPLFKLHQLRHLRREHPGRQDQSRTLRRLLPVPPPARGHGTTSGPVGHRGLHRQRGQWGHGEHGHTPGIAPHLAHYPLDNHNILRKNPLGCACCAQRAQHNHPPRGHLTVTAPPGGVGARGQEAPHGR